MKSPIVSLTRKLIAAKAVVDRIEISKKIFQCLESAPADFGKTERVIRNLFIYHVKAFAMTANRKQRLLITKLADFYRRNYPMESDNVPIAA